jgi:hypothetical protein
MGTFLQPSEKYGGGPRNDELYYRSRGLIKPATPVMLVPNDVTAKEWRSIMCLPWSKQARDSKDGTFTFVVSFVDRGTYKSYANFATPLKAKKKTRNAD